MNGAPQILYKPFSFPLNSYAGTGHIVTLYHLLILMYRLYHFKMRVRDDQQICYPSQNLVNPTVSAVCSSTWYMMTD